MQIDRNQLMIELSRLRGGKFLSISTATDTKMNKTNGYRDKQQKRVNPFYGRVFSSRTSVYQPCFDYKGAVERARAKSDDYDGEVEFNVGETWYTRIKDAEGYLTAFAEHKRTGNLYFVGRELNKGKTTYIAKDDISELADEPGSPPTGRILYRAGDTIPFAAFSDFFPEYKPSSKQGLSEEEEIKPRTLKIESIRAIKPHGARYVVQMPILRDEHESVTRRLARTLADMPDVDIESIPQQYREDEDMTVTT